MCILLTGHLHLRRKQQIQWHPSLWPWKVLQVQSQPSWVTFLYLCHPAGNQIDLMEIKPRAFLSHPCPSLHHIMPLVASHLLDSLQFPFSPQNPEGHLENMNRIMSSNAQNPLMASHHSQKMIFISYCRPPRLGLIFLPTLLTLPPPLFLFGSPLHIPSLCSEWSPKISCGWCLLIQFLGQVFFFQKYLTWPPHLPDH